MQMSRQRPLAGELVGPNAGATANFQYLHAGVARLQRLCAARCASTTRGATLGRLGSLEVRLARSAAEVRRAQRLRYRVFYEEMSASADATAMLAHRDIDTFDAYCDHLLVLDHDARTAHRQAGNRRHLSAAAPGHRRAAQSASTAPANSTSAA